MKKIDTLEDLAKMLYEMTDGAVSLSPHSDLLITNPQESYARRHENKGNEHIRHALRKKKVDESLIRAAILSLPAEEVRAEKQAKKKWRLLGDVPLDIKKKKTLSFLLSRGFSASIVFSIVNTLLEENEIGE